MKLHNVELSLAWRNSEESARHGFGAGLKKVMAKFAGLGVPGYCEESCAVGVGEVLGVVAYYGGDGEELFGAGEEVLWMEGVEAEDDTVGGEDGDAVGFHVDEGHHHSCFGVGWGGKCCVDMGLRSDEGGAFLSVGYAGFVAVVAIGDDQFFVDHGGEYQVDEGWVG